jgi:hypothetical protein
MNLLEGEYNSDKMWSLVSEYHCQFLSNSLEEIDLNHELTYFLIDEVTLNIIILNVILIDLYSCVLDI